MNKHYAAADWHGNLNIAKQILNYMDETDTLYFLGDAIDRGPHGLEVLFLLLNNPRVRFLRGNHEEMMMDCLPHIIKQRIDDLNFYDEEYHRLLDEWTSNGGDIVYNKLFEISTQDIIDLKLVMKRDLSTFEVYNNINGQTIMMEHAGHSPFAIRRHKHDATWDRNHFNDPWDEGASHIVDCDPEKCYMIHGHTPVQYLKYLYGYIDKPPTTREDMIYKRMWLYDEEIDKMPTPEILTYCGGHKIDLDLCTIVTNRAALLDLDTFEVKYFEGTDE